MGVPNEELWLEYYDLATKYSKQHGGLIFDPHNLSDEELKLRQWIYTQRYKGNNGKLPSNKVQLLEDIGMIWNPAEEAWEKGFNLVKTYAKENKNFSPPRKMVVDGVNLNNWITQQRGEYNKGRLSQEKIDKLNDIGMIWKVQSESWDYHFELFKNYVSETGSVLIEDEYETKDGVRLGNWIGQQRKDYKCGRISEDRIHKLETLGMVWDVYELMWQKMFALAKEYYDTYGDSLIPLDYVVGDVRLGLWLKNQRGDYKDGIVPQHRIEKFKEIDMVWNVKSCINTSFPEQTIFY